jgi:predicted dehydrogenase
MSRKIQAGVVGTGPIVDFLHLPALQSHSQAAVVAVCGRTREHTDQIAKKYNIPKAFTDYKEMIQQGGLDAIVIATPDDLHYEITMHALEAGLHVLCEKPLALTVRQAWEMYQKAEQVGVKHMVMFTYRGMPFFQYIHNLMKQDYIGRCDHCEFRYLMGGGRNQEYRWRADPKRANGNLADMGSHMIDLARWLVGDITRVSAQLGTFVDYPGPNGERMDPTNVLATLLVEFSNGSQGMIHVSCIAHVADRDMVQQVNLYGEGGSLEIDVPYGLADVGATLRVALNKDESFKTVDVPDSYWENMNRTDLYGYLMGMSFGARSFIDAILENRPVTPSFYDGYKAQQVIEAALESHKTGKWISIGDKVHADKAEAHGLVEKSITRT